MSTPFSLPLSMLDSNLPVQFMAPPAMPSVSDCFPFGSVDLGKYVVYQLLSGRERAVSVALSSSK
jgi:hypothetical protein